MHRFALGLGLGAALLTLGAAAPVLASGPSDRAGATPTAERAAGGVTIRATVPTLATAKLGGKRVAARFARPTVLQRRTTAGWTTVEREVARRTGVVAYAVAPATATTYRVVAPAHRVRVTRKVADRTSAKRVTLRAWTGPARSATAPVGPAAPPIQPPSQQPGQQPSQQPIEEPIQEPTSPSVSLVGGVPDALAGAMTDPVTDAAGRFIVFSSSSADLVPGDDNGREDVFLLDTETGVLELISRAADGTVAAGPSYQPDISADGEHIAFASSATDLLPGLDIDYPQVYAYDRPTAQFELISKAPDGTPGDQTSSNPALSGDGRFVAFDSFAVNVYEVLQYVPQTRNVFRHDRSTGRNEILTFPRGEWTGQSWWPSMSDDGMRVTFLSQNESLVAEDGNGKIDVFLYDFGSRVRKMVSRRSDGGVLNSGSNQPLISGDGSAVVWSTDARGVVPGDDNESSDAFRYDVAKRANSLLSREPSGRPLDAISGPMALDATGSTVVVGSTWQSSDFGTALYLADSANGRIVPLWTGAGGRPVMGRAVVASADGSRVVFVTSAALTATDTDQSDDLYVWERGY